MTRRFGLLFVAIFALVFGIMNITSGKVEVAASAESAHANPLLSKWEGKYGGVPPFDKVKIADFKPALEAAMTENLAEIDAITATKAAPNFENSIAALERTGLTLSRVTAIYGIWTDNLSNREVEAIESEMAPKLAAFGDKITQNAALFDRVSAVYNSPSKSKLTAEQQRLVWVYYTSFVRGGAKLDAAAKKRVSEINQELAGHFTKFGQNQTGDESSLYVTLGTEADLAGLSAALKDSASAAAAAKKVKAAGIIRNTRSSVDPFLTYSDRRDLREKVWKMFINRGDNGDARDNNAVISPILKLRAERAKLLGFPTHAHFRLENTMAKKPENAMKLLEGVWVAAKARVQEEVSDMQALADKEGAKITIEPWDYKYYMEKVRKDKYDLDQNEVKEYLQVDKMLEAMHWVAGELFNFTFTRVSGVPVFHPDVTVYEVKNKTNGKHVGLWYFDPYARDGKRSGAWMNSYRDQRRFDGDVTTIVSNNSNFVKGKPGEPALISWDDASTMFHEFGHALHGLSSNVNYPSLSGTSVARDYVEFPSTILEDWLGTPDVLQKFAVHYKTGKPIPQTLVDKIKKASTFHQGFDTTELVASALIDMKLHLAGDATIDADKFERDTLAELGMPREIVMRHRTPQFGHIFSSDGYSAGYYSYVWSEVLAADAVEAFAEGKGSYDKTVAAKLVKHIFSVGNTIDPADAYRAFRGRDPNVDALMRKRGFPVKK